MELAEFRPAYGRMSKAHERVPKAGRVDDWEVSFPFVPRYAVGTRGAFFLRGEFGPHRGRCTSSSRRSTWGVADGRGGTEWYPSISM